MFEKVKQYAKFLAAVLGAVVVSFAGLLPAEWAPWIQAAAAFLSAIAVLTIPNAPTELQKEEIAKGLGVTPEAVAVAYDPKHSL
jgi:hypothetical protein